MSSVRASILILAGLTVGLGAEFASFATPAPASDPASDQDAVLVVAPPWNGGATAVVQAAGGWEVGATRAPLSVLATGTTESALREAGAWFLLDPGLLDLFCISG